MKHTMTRKRVENLEKKIARDAHLAREASLGGAQFGDHKPLKWRPFARIIIKL